MSLCSLPGLMWADERTVIIYRWVWKQLHEVPQPNAPSAGCVLSSKTAAHADQSKTPNMCLRNCPHSGPRGTGT